MRKMMREVALDRVQLLPSMFKDRYDLNRAYLMSLKNQNLLQNYYLEAGLWMSAERPEDLHWGWESPTCELRGHFLGHWLSAAAHAYRCSGDQELKAKADAVVSELARCQRENGGLWAGPIPEKYLDWLARGKKVWAPHYTLHKTLMGLVDMYRLAGNEQALAVLINFAEWFHRWSGQFSREEFDNILDVETGGMLEVWADLYQITGDERHLQLLNRYDRPRFFEPLLAGKDVLTNMHANTTIPEVLGAARAWEVTGEERWFNIVEAYWDQAVRKRGFFCTGSQTSGEVWTPPFRFADRLSDTNQEHCVVYNMIRLAEFLFRWTGETEYADYIERNLYNGILAQQHPKTGMVAYFLPLEPGAQKKWGTPTDDFWCCHGTMVQAQTRYNSIIYYEHDDGLFVTQYIPSRLGWKKDGTPVTVEQTISPQTGDNVALREINFTQWHRPDHVCVELKIQCQRPLRFAISCRIPWWTAGEVAIKINGRSETASVSTGRLVLNRTWHNDRLELRLPKTICIEPLPDAPERISFMDGPVVLAGLTDEDIALCGHSEDLSSILVPDNVRVWQTWLNGYRTRHQPKNIKFKPLYEITDERYTVYFPLYAHKQPLK